MSVVSRITGIVLVSGLALLTGTSARASTREAPEDLVGHPPRESTLGRSAWDRAMERTLATAPVVRTEPVGDGITRPARLTLDDGETRVRAVFKTVDIERNEVSYADRWELNFTDRYVYEVAAYRLDRYLGLGLVPPTTLRTVDGEEGSVQFWIENAVKMSEAAEQGLDIPDMDLFFRRVLYMNILDALIYNTDRGQRNILVTPHDDGFYLIDHSRAFRIDKKLPEWREDWAESTVPPGVADRLRSLDLEVLRALLGDLIEGTRIRPILKRRDLLLRELRRRGHLP